MVEYGELTSMPPYGSSPVQVYIRIKLKVLIINQAAELRGLVNMFNDTKGIDIIAREQ